MARVLVSAYACEPHSGSEPGVGWNWARQAARHGHSVHVVTRANNREAIESHLETEQVPGLTIEYLDLPPWLQLVKKRTGTTGLLVYYYLWQLALARRARALHHKHRFQLLHHVTFANDWLPTGLVFVAEVPLIWGPIGGSTHRAPRDVLREWPKKDRRYELARSVLQTMFLKFDPLLRWSRRRATAILPYTYEAMAGIPHKYASKCRVVTHIGVDSMAEVNATNRRARSQPSEQLRIVTGGRLVHWKGIDLVIEALALHLGRQPGSAHLSVTGSGPWRQRLVRLTRRLGVDDAVEFLGRLPQQSDVIGLVRDADLYALPTWRDGPPVAILEAMSVGTAILCLDLGATAELVPPEAGILIEPTDRAGVVGQIAQAIAWGCANRSELQAMGAEGARTTGQRHLWTEIGAVIDEVYESVIDGK